MDLFAKIVSSFQKLIIFAKGFILDVLLGSERTSGTAQPAIHYLFKVVTKN